MRAPANPAEDGIFASHALQLRAHGLAVLPTDGKVPLIKNWNKWRHLPSPKAVSQLARQFPRANVAILPGPSGLFVADVDAADQAAEVEALLGRTPLHVLSDRGEHLYYRHTDDSNILPANLAALGLKVDLKAGNSVVIAPPSLHKSGAVYRHDGCDWGALKHIPEPNFERLGELLRRKSEGESRSGMRDNSRKQWLNDRLCREVSFCDTFEDLLDAARTLNEEIPDRFAGFEPLVDEVVIKRAAQVWKDREAGQLTRWLGRNATVTITADEQAKLCAMDRNGADAVVLLIKLRAEHGARCKRGEMFALAAEAMARAQTIPRWHWKRYAAATKLLLRAGFIVLVCKHRPMINGGRPALYSLVETR
jgi:hypothetical protein